MMVAAYEEYRAQLPPGLWEGYARDIRNVRGRLSESTLLIAVGRGLVPRGAAPAGHMDGEAESGVVGAVTYYPPDSDGRAGVRLLAVHPDARGQGLARPLMDECIRRAQDGGAKALGLHTTTMMAVARAMYERMGFVRDPARDMEVAPGVTVMAYVLDLP